VPTLWIDSSSNTPLALVSAIAASSVRYQIGAPRECECVELQGARLALRAWRVRYLPLHFTAQYRSANLRGAYGNNLIGE
jgi:hypothetical protein